MDYLLWGIAAAFSGILAISTYRLFNGTEFPKEKQFRA